MEVIALLKIKLRSRQHFLAEPDEYVAKCNYIVPLFLFRQLELRDFVCLFSLLATQVRLLPVAHLHRPHLLTLELERELHHG